MSVPAFAWLAAARGFLRALWRAVRQTFHEVTGTMFLLFALSGVSSAVRQWHRGAPLWPVWLAGVFAVMMAGFGITSFRMARRVR
jgi:hypothetical protein